MIQSHKYDLLADHLTGMPFVPLWLSDGITQDILSTLSTALTEDNMSILRIVRVLSKSSLFCVLLVNKYRKCIDLIVSKMEPSNHVKDLARNAACVDILKNIVCKKNFSVFFNMNVKKLELMLMELKSLFGGNESQTFTAGCEIVKNVMGMMSFVFFLRLPLRDTEGVLTSTYLNIIASSMSFSHLIRLDTSVILCLHYMTEESTDRAGLMTRMNQHSNLVPKIINWMHDYKYTPEMACKALTAVDMMLHDSDYEVENLMAMSWEKWENYVNGLMTHINDQHLDQEHFFLEVILASQLEIKWMKKHKEVFSAFMFTSRHLEIMKYLKEVDSRERFNDCNVNLYEMSLCVEKLMRENGCVFGMPVDLYEVIGVYVGDTKKILSDIHIANAECFEILIMKTGADTAQILLNNDFLGAINKMIKIELRNDLFVVRNRLKVLEKWLKVLKQILSVPGLSNGIKETDDAFILLDRKLSYLQKCVNVSPTCVCLLKKI